MWQGESPQNSTFPADDEHLFGDCHCADDIFGLLCVVELIHVVDLVDIGLVVDEPAYLPTHFAVSHLGGWLEHGETGCLALVLPHVAEVFGAGDDVGP